MSIKINIGVMKKIGLPDYGSAGSHCDIEIEADLSVLNDAAEFQRRVHDAYELARASVEQELNAHRPNGQQSQRYNPAPPQQSEYPTANNAEPKYVASSKQVEYIGRLSNGIKGLDKTKLDAYCTTKYGRGMMQLSPREASYLIDEIKAAKAGKGGLV